MSVLDLVSVSLRIVLVGIAKNIIRSSYARFWIRSEIERTRIQLLRNSRNWIPIICLDRIRIQGKTKIRTPIQTSLSHIAWLIMNTKCSKTILSTQITLTGGHSRNNSL